MDLSRLRLAALVPSALAVLLATAACTPATPAATAGPSAPTHDIDAGGGAEVAAPALALVTADHRGAISLLDLTTERTETLAEPVDGDVAVTADGRLVFRTRMDGGTATVEVFDSGRWTIPHGDHSHSFRGAARGIGTVVGAGEVHVAGAGTASALAFGGEEVRVLAHDRLSADAGSAATLPMPHAGPVVPFAGGLLVPSEGGMIEVVDAAGEPVPGAGVPCARVTDADVTRVGVVFACPEGAVLFTRAIGGAVSGEAIPYPAGAAPATALDGRADRPDLAGAAGDRGAWLLDVRRRSWSLLPSDVPILHAAALGDDRGRTVAVDGQGRIRILAPDGTVLARSEPVVADAAADPVLRERVRLVVSAQHSYLLDPSTGIVHELDHTAAAVTRRFTDLDASFVHLVG